MSRDTQSPTSINAARQSINACQRQSTSASSFLPRHSQLDCRASLSQIVAPQITTTHKEGLVVGMRSMPGNPYDGHTLAEALEQAEILSDVTPEIAVVDRGYKGVDIEGVKIYHPGLRRGITRGLRAMIRRRSAIEPAIGHMKTDGKLDRNWLKGALGDAMHAVLCGAGHNLRIILRKLRLFYAFVLIALFIPVDRRASAG
ncbi:IS5 family transposase [Paraburkholderia bannensis]|uniref:IS5 family transposase n=1 Tax=Paraburkholderia bannensis TaxID=765414 RepID=A0A7W9U6S2_9BURK|nr:IS5 family transposase [Paraburkholderia sp. WP4_3_2]MBB6107035.1 IS5 family transposase [Paraburkholderia bannensis]